MKRIALFGILLFLCAGFANFSISEKSRAEEADPLKTGDGIYWAPAKRLTENGQSDTKPQIDIDKNQYSRIIWQRQGYWYKKVNLQGNITTSEKFMTSNVVKGFGSQYHFGPTIAMDSQGSAHVVWDNGTTETYYSKISNDGVVLVPPTLIASSDACEAHQPSIAVGPDDYVHIVYAFAPPGPRGCCCPTRDIAYTKLYNDGTIVAGKHNILVSSDVDYDCAHATVTVDHNNTVHVSFGSEVGGWIARLDKYGIKYGASVKVYESPKYSAASMAVSPDMNLHFAWLDASDSGDTSLSGTLYYSKYNNDGTKVYKSNIQITQGKTATSQPSIAADSKNNVFIFWSDNREGSSKIFYVKLPSEDWERVPDPVVLTNEKSESKNPAVAINAYDNLHVVWDDTRDGNNEIYYKFARNFGVGMEMKPEEQVKIMFVHPNERKSANIIIKNIGRLNDTIKLALNTERVVPRWNFTLDKYSVTLLPLQMEKIVLTVIGPPTGNDGDVSIVVINA
ncbi:MAG: hypothetical protein AB1779_08380, partial [Candidatus Thermoplasmatota archaeon]